MTAPVAWKTPAGFVALTQPEIEAVAQAVVGHIQTCFAAEAAVAAQIAALSDPEEFDLETAFVAPMRLHSPVRMSACR
ncbi:DUF4376 domain-containing protein [Tritonibacter mobilis]|uniref:DUF4376 domain-containing protein n=1 Tax=Tritonibacter mobilis TaxID=379347 RepID=UPI0029811A11|nr:DUF4376 domain-containing protein [Tritonibacter mobilis]